ncbi:outer membrane protein assembly factor BamB family protein [Streptomyces lutosisoli]|uniref:PQQ-binding-like beta-propeller repeat protein n=1 Tax=Streptomyces lutosisoli TaxID=2665721 RepID=A0ABW2VNG3_9ACTN
MVVLSTEVTEALPTVPAATKRAATKRAATKSAATKSAATERAATKSAATKASPVETAAVEFPSSLVRRRPLRALLPATLALLLAAPLLAAAHQARPAPYGDRLTVHTLHARVEHGTRPPLRTAGATVEAYDAQTGRPRWTYTREGRRPLGVLPARGDAIALWDDGLVTATVRGDGSAVRWHRALPGDAPWLAAHGGAGVLRALGPRMLAVVTPQRIAAYRIADGDLRWLLPARRGCAFVPARAARARAALLIAQPCAATDSWTGEIIAVDDLGRITPDRTPLGNGRRGERHSLEHAHTGKVVARPR